MTWGAVIGGGVALIGGMLSSGGSGSSGAHSSTTTYDPYAPYRGAAAIQLQTLMKNPGSAADTSYGKAMTQAASRAMASQGYTGSGNALVAAADAGGRAYQQEFNNLSMLAGADQNPAYAQGMANNQSNYLQQQNNQMWGQIGSLVGNIFNQNPSNTTGTVI